MNRKPWVVGLLVGVAIGVIVGLLMTLVGWQDNPSGVYQNEHAIQWGNLIDTWLSWFIPVAGLTTVLSVAVLVWLSRS